jgi:hypothetical protein
MRHPARVLEERDKWDGRFLDSEQERVTRSSAGNGVSERHPTETQRKRRKRSYR